MQLVLAIVHDSVEVKVLNNLALCGYRVTRVATTGGFLRRGSAALLIDAETGQTQAIIDVIRAACPPPETSQKHIILFVLDATHSERV